MHGGGGAQEEGGGAAASSAPARAALPPPVPDPSRPEAPDLPSDVLKVIARLAVEQARPGNRLLVLLAMAGVCRQWRELAREVPSDLPIAFDGSADNSLTGGTPFRFRRCAPAKKEGTFLAGASLLTGERERRFFREERGRGGERGRRALPPHRARPRRPRIARPILDAAIWTGAPRALSPPARARTPAALCPRTSEAGFGRRQRRVALRAGTTPTTPRALP
jgi:hypothetical protein